MTANNMDSMLRLSSGFDIMNSIGSTTAADFYNPASAAGLQAATLAAANQTWQYGYQQYPFASSTQYSRVMDMTQFSGESFFEVNNRNVLLMEMRMIR